MIAIPKSVEEILHRLHTAGHQGYCVGGCVRDRLLGREPKDYDITTSAKPEEVMALFAPHAIPTGLQHGTVTVVSEGERVEVTTFRQDGAYTDHRRPDAVTFTASLTEDLSRRDFTINAMAMDLDGQVTDPFGGKADLHRGMLRCVGAPAARFQEDALRIMRALRFAAELSLTVEDGTAAALRRQRELLKEISVERILTELNKLLCAPAVEKVLLTYPEVIGVVLPEILPAVGFDQHNRHHCYDVYEHSVRAMAALPPEPMLRWTMFLHDLGKPETFSLDEAGVGHFYGHGRRSAELAHTICRRLRMDRRSSETIEELVRLHDTEIPLTERGVRRMLRRVGEEQLRRLIAVKRGDNLAQHPDYRGRQETLSQLETLLNMVLSADACFSLKQLAVKGGDLTAIGITGPDIGRTLVRLLDEVVEEHLPNDRGALMAYAEEIRDEERRERG